MDKFEQAREALTKIINGKEVRDPHADDGSTIVVSLPGDEIEALAASALASLSPTTPVDGVGAGPRKLFPILGSGGQKIDFGLVAEHGKQAKANHYQSVERLAERGGLSWSELYAVLHDQRWQKMDENDAIIACRKLETRYLSALASPEAEARLRERVAELEEERDDLLDKLDTRIAMHHETEEQLDRVKAEARLAQQADTPGVDEPPRYSASDTERLLQIAKAIDDLGWHHSAHQVSNAAHTINSLQKTERKP